MQKAKITVSIEYGEVQSSASAIVEWTEDNESETADLMTRHDRIKSLDCLVLALGEEVRHKITRLSQAKKIERLEEAEKIKTGDAKK